MCSLARATLRSELSNGAINAALPSGPHAGSDDEDEGEVRAFVRVRRALGADLARALQAAQGVRSSRKAAGPVRVQMDPLELV